MIYISNILQAVIDTARKFGAAKVILFGSRARGDNRERSDIDIAVYGVSKSNQAAFRSDIADIPTLLEFDIVFVSSETDKVLLNNIEKDGKVIMSKFTEKYQKLISATDRLKEDSVRDGAIQRFEFCTELAWKTVREYLIEQGYTDINSPKSVMKTAFSDGLLTNENGWLEILESRNITSHVYDERTAATIFDNIKKIYTPLFEELIKNLDK